MSPHCPGWDLYDETLAILLPAPSVPGIQHRIYTVYSQKTPAEPRSREKLLEMQGWGEEGFWRSCIQDALSGFLRSSKTLTPCSGYPMGNKVGNEG